MNSDCELDSVLVVIPARDEEATIGRVIQELQTIGLTQIRVVDNGSRDRTAAIARALGADVCWEPHPGYGRACWRGLEKCPTSIEWILFCDGDGSDDLAQISQFLDARDEFDFILGNRCATQAGRDAMTPVQRFGNALATRLIDWGWGYTYRDLGPLRLIRRSALEPINMRDRGFGWTVEMQVRAIECHLRILEIPVRYRRRQGGDSKISGTVLGSVRAGTIILSTLGYLFARRLIQPRLIGKPSTQQSLSKGSNKSSNQSPK